MWPCHVKVIHADKEAFGYKVTPPLPRAQGFGVIKVKRRGGGGYSLNVLVLCAHTNTLCTGADPEFHSGGFLAKIAKTAPTPPLILKLIWRWGCILMGDCKRWVSVEQAVLSVQF
jgi:hypothetical protein